MRERLDCCRDVQVDCITYNYEIWVLLVLSKCNLGNGHVQPCTNVSCVGLEFWARDRRACCSTCPEHLSLWVVLSHSTEWNNIFIGLKINIRTHLKLKMMRDFLSKNTRLLDLRGSKFSGLMLKTLASGQC